MKERHTDGGQVLYADYVVPVYNLNADTRHLTAFSNENMYVDVWAVRATLGNEYASMQASMQRSENKYRAALENAPYDEQIRMNMMWIKSVRELFANPKYHQVIDTELKLVVAKLLREKYMKTDLEHAKYLLGFSYFACMKEVLR